MFVCYHLTMAAQRETGDTSAVAPPTGAGVDRTLIRALLALTPAERVARLTAEAQFLRAIDAARASVRRQTLARLTERG